MEQNQKTIGNYLLYRLLILYSLSIAIYFLRPMKVMGGEIQENTIILLAFSYLMTLSFVLLREKAERVSYFLASQVFYDLLFTTAIIYYSGPVDSIFVPYYLLNIMFVAILFNSRAAILAALLAGGFYFSVSYAATEFVWSEKSFTILITETSFIVVALLAGQLVEEIRRNRMRIGKLEILSDRIVESLDAGLITINRNGEIIRTNGMARQIIQSINEQAAIPKTYHELSLLAEAGRDISSEEASAAALREVTIDSQLRRFLISRIPLGDGHHIFLLRDLTTIFALEETVRIQSHHAAVGQLAASLAHEIRNPLAAISGAAQILTPRLGENEFQRLTKIIVKETERVDALVVQVLKFARTDSIERAKIDLREIMREAVEAFRVRQDLAQSGVSLVYEEPKIQAKDGFVIELNKGQIIEVVNNVLTNALQAMREFKVAKGKGSILVKMSLLQGNYAQITIADDGPGIDQQIKHRIFDPFFSTKSEGTGLGLARVYKIIKDHKGRVEVDNRPPPESGTIVKVILPRAA